MADEEYKDEANSATEGENKIRNKKTTLDCSLEKTIQSATGRKEQGLNTQGRARQLDR